MKNLARLVFLIASLSVNAQLPDLSLPLEVCLEESFLVSDVSTGYNSYEWDFCEGDLLNPGINTLVSNLNTSGLPFGLDLIKVEENWYGFLVSFNNTLNRLDFGNSLTNAPSVVPISVAGISQGYDVKIIQSGDEWYGFVTNFNTSSLLRIDFGTDLSNTNPSSELVSITDISLSLPRGLDVVESEGIYYAMIGNAGTSNLSFLSFTEGITGSALGQNIIGNGLTYGITMFEDGGWHALTGSSSIQYVSLGVDLSSPTIIVSDLNLDASITNATNMVLFNDLDNYYLFTGSRSGSIYQINLGVEIEDLNGLVTDLGRPGGVTDLIAFAGVKDKSSYYQFALSTGSSDLNRIDFTDNCNSSPSVFLDSDPTVSYSSTGIQNVTLTVKDSDGNIERTTKTIEVVNSSAPDISFAINNSRCVEVTNTFTSLNSSGDILSYSWDFDGDGIEDSTEPNPNFQYTAAGTYSISLAVTSADCSNFFEDIITVYDEPMTDFDLSYSSLCVGSEILFTNTTPGDFGGNITYDWDFNGEAISSNEDESYVFTTPGSKSITLTAAIPGCEVIQEEIIIIQDGPTPAFSAISQCEGDVVSFINNSLNATSFLWDFGDGESSNDSSPTHIYSSGGFYEVMLTAFDDFGCEVTVTEEIEIFNAPNANFSYDIICSNSDVQFSNTSLLSSGSFDTFSWYVNGILSSNDENPVINFNEEGPTQVRLEVVSSSGCSDSYEELVMVMPSPLAEITSIINPPGEISSFFHQSISDETIISWTWNIDGQNFTTQNVDYIFETPGIFLVTLEVTSDNLCSSLTSTEITVVDVPEFFIPDMICQNENLYPIDVSGGFARYEWDFCEGDLQNEPSSQIIGSIIGGTKTGISVVQDDNGDWFGFVMTFSNSIVRLDFGSSLSNTPSISNLNVSNVFQGYSIKIINEGGEWYGFVTNFGNSSLLRISFGENLDNSSPVSEIILISNASLSLPRGIDIVKSKGIYYALIGNAGNSNISFLSFPDGLESQPKGTNFEGDGPTYGVKFINDGEWFALTGSNSIQKIDFGSDLANPEISIANLDLDASVPSPTNLFIWNDLDNYYLFAGSRNGNIYNVNLGKRINDQTGSVTNLERTGAITDLIAFDGVKDSSNYFQYAISTGSLDLYRIDYPDNCQSNPAVFLGMNPLITYEDPGNHNITLSVSDHMDRISRTTKPIIVESNIAPEATFSIDDNRCIDNANTFTPTLSGLSYSWDFDGDGVEDSNSEIPEFRYNLPGDYAIILSVFDGSCSNTYIDSISVYESPNPFFISPDQGCPNAEIIFQNIASSTVPAEVISYLWDFNGEGQASSEEASFVFTTSGDKTISLTAEVPGCSVTFQEIITINEGSDANFFANSVCQNDLTQFTNTTVNGVSYLWDFGDGFTSTSENPSHLFSAAGNYNVSLTATNAEGCEDVEVIEVAVLDIPQVDFDFDIPCTSTEGTSFFDLTTVENADVVGWSWRVNGEEVSTQQNPELVFPDEGLNTITLVVTSSNGCESTYNEDIEILGSPNPDFSSQIGCQGEFSSFSDITISEGNQIVSWLWNVNETFYNTQTIDHIFDTAGTYEVTLEVTSQNFCSESITQMVEVLELPTNDFIIDGDCNNVIINASDQSTESNDPIVSRRWMLDGQNVGNGNELFLTNLSEGTYDLELQVETQTGCIVSSNQTLEINTSPNSSFTFDKFFGVPGDMLSFTNTSTGASTYQWLLDGAEISTSSTSQNFIFEEAGDFQVSLVSTNSLGCSDTINQIVNIAVPVIDLKIRGFDLIEEGSTGKIFLEIENQSNLPIDVTQATIELENQLSVTEEVELLINVGEVRLVGLDVGIPLELSQPTYFCVTLASQYEGFPDINPVDNEKCITIEPSIVIEDPFPNPVRDQFRLKVVTPSNGQITIQVINSSGKLEMEESFNTLSGLNNYFLDMTALYPGTYFVLVAIDGKTTQRRVIKL